MVTTWLTCRRQFKYAHILNLEPKTMSVPLYRGNLGHHAMQRYTEARLDGKSHDDSMKVALQLFVHALQNNADKIDTILQTQSIFQNYMGFHKGWPEWKLHEPEQKFSLPLTDDIKMTIRYDSKVEEIKTGKLHIVDYKYTYRFWSPDEHALNGQMPKYISVMRANGIEIHGGILEEIRTEKLGKEKASDPKQTWRRTPYYPTPAKKRNMLRQHIAASLEIEEAYNLSPEEQEIKLLPCLNKMVCKNCNFADLCNSENDGKDIAVDIQIGYQPNSYGYDNEETNKEQVIASL
jgi:hypothetical protein